MTPEAERDGGILYLENGDILYLGLRERRIEFVEAESFLNNTLKILF